MDIRKLIKMGYDYTELVHTSDDQILRSLFEWGLFENIPIDEYPISSTLVLNEIDQYLNSLKYLEEYIVETMSKYFERMFGEPKDGFYDFWLKINGKDKKMEACRKYPLKKHPIMHVEHWCKTKFCIIDMDTNLYSLPLNENEKESITAFATLSETACEDIKTIWDLKRAVLVAKLTTHVKSTYLDNLHWLFEARGNSLRLSWQQSLVNSICGYIPSIEAKSIVDYPDILNITIERALATLPDERMITILKERFAKHKTLEEIGWGFDLTRERIREIEQRAIRLMRLGKRKAYLDVAFTFYKQSYKEYIMSYLENPDSIVSQIIYKIANDSIAHSIILINESPAIRKLFESESPIHWVDHIKYVDDISKEKHISSLTKIDDISCLDLTVRTHNTLKRYGRHTIGDAINLLNIPDSDFMHTAKKAYDETYNALVRKGFFNDLKI